MRGRNTAPRTRWRRFSVPAVSNNAGADAPAVTNPTSANCRAPEKMNSDEAMVSGTPNTGRAPAP